MTELGPLPFNLNEADLSKAQITYTSYSAKTGVGKAEITILGSGQVKLLEEATRDDPNPRVFESELPTEVMVRLLDLMEEENFFALDDLYRHTGVPMGTRVIALSLPGNSKTVMLDQPATCLPFERIAGAVKFAVGFAVPKALQNRFFQRL